MEGLDISEVLLSELEYSGRLDAEYYQPHYLKYEEKIKEKAVPLSSISNFLIGPFGSAFTVDNYTEDKSYRYIRGKDVKPLKLMDDDNVYMPEEDYKRLSRYALKENDILVSVVGTLGNAAIVTKNDLPAIFSCKSTVLRPLKVNEKYLLVYLNTKYGKELLLRKERGAIQKGLNLDDLKTLDVFVPSDKFQDVIENIYNSSMEMLNKSKKAYEQAESSLLDFIGLNNIQLSRKATNIKSFKEVFIDSGRMDAEYYQPKYDEIEENIKSFNEWDVLGDQLEKIDTGEYSPEYFHKDEADDLTFYIRSTNIKNAQIDIDENFFVKRKDFVRKANEGDIVTARVGTVGIFGEVREELQGAVYSDNVISFRMYDNFIPSVYTLLFNTKYYFELIDRFARGSVQQRLNQETLKDLIIPIIPFEQQQKIASIIEESFLHKAQFNKSLEIAKQAVEIAIEENEATAIKFINENIKEFD